MPNRTSIMAPAIIGISTASPRSAVMPNRTSIMLAVAAVLIAGTVAAAVADAQGTGVADTATTFSITDLGPAPPTLPAAERFTITDLGPR